MSINIQPSCTRFISEGKEYPNCANTSGEVKNLPLMLFLEEGNNNDYYIDYYQSIIGNAVYNYSPPIQVGSVNSEPKGSPIPGDSSTYCLAVTGSAGLDNFWRSINNIFAQRVCSLSISQACPIRNCFFNNSVYFASCNDSSQFGNKMCFSACGGGAEYTSGGFVQNCKLINGGTNFNFVSQQQFLAKDCDASAGNGFSGGAWHITLLNCRGNFDSSKHLMVNDDTFPKYVIKFGLFNGEYKVFFSKLKPFQEPGNGTPLTGMNIKQYDTALGRLPLDINAQLNSSNDTVILEAGIYYVSGDINLNCNLFSVGLSIIFLTGKINISSGKIVSGILFDVMNNFEEDVITCSDNVILMDVFIRIGGFFDYAKKFNPGYLNFIPNLQNLSVGTNGAILRITGNNCYLENLWIWRADHTWSDSTNSAINITDPLANYCKHGVIVDGNNVKAAGLQVEHFNQSSLIWNGSNGTVVMFQNEIAYYPSDTTNETLNYYPVELNGDNFQGYNMGVYCYFADSNTTVPSAFSVSGKNVKINQAFTRFLNGSGSIQNVIYDQNSKKYYGSSVPSTGKESLVIFSSPLLSNPNSPPCPICVPPKFDWLWIILLILLFVSIILLIISIKRVRSLND